MEKVHNHHKKKSPYMPKLCSSTSIIRGVHHPKTNHLSSSSSSSSSSFDPSSPRVTCMGQVKRDAAFSNGSNHFRFIGVPATTRTATCRKPKVNLSRKNSVGSTTVTARKAVEDYRSARGYKGHCTVPEVNISEMDPPLPVVKTVKDSFFDREEVNLWKRRGEFASKSLELSHIHVPKNIYIRGREIHASWSNLSC